MTPLDHAKDVLCLIYSSKLRTETVLVLAPFFQFPRLTVCACARPRCFALRWRLFGALLLLDGVIDGLLYSLENLAAMEETVVRDKAVESACVVIGLMQGGQQEVRRREIVNDALWFLSSLYGESACTSLHFTIDAIVQCSSVADSGFRLERRY